jgi:N-acetylneuraminic acid mutarotase
MEVKMNAEVVGSGGLKAGVSALPTAIDNLGAAAVGNKIYLLGGRKGTSSTSSSSYSSAIRIFDTETNKITSSTQTLSSPVSYTAAVAVDTKIYMFGGYYYESGYGEHWVSVRIFDTETNEMSWVSLPNSCRDMAAVAVGNKIYLFGGRYSALSGSSYYSAIYVFNTETNSIDKISQTLPTGAYDIGAAAVGNKIYLFGGKKKSTPYLTTINVFDIDQGTITTLETTLPSTHSSPVAVAIGAKIYLFGSSSSNKIYEFDTETNGLTELNTTLPTTIYDLAATSVGNKIYLFGGYSSGLLSSIHEFTALMELPENHMFIEASPYQNMTNLLPNMEIGVKNVYIGNAEGKGEIVDAYIYKEDGWYNFHTNKYLPIKFSVDDIIYSCDKGISWEEWITSAATGSDSFIITDGKVYHKESNAVIKYPAGLEVGSADKIGSGTEYTFDA